MPTINITCPNSGYRYGRVFRFRYLFGVGFKSNQKATHIHVFAFFGGCSLFLDIRNPGGPRSAVRAQVDGFQEVQLPHSADHLRVTQINRGVSTIWVEMP